MILSSTYLWQDFGNNRQTIDEAWFDLLPSLLDEFYHPFYHSNSFQILDKHLYSEKKGTVFLKDGILSLVSLFARIYQNQHLINLNFALPLEMAPVIPLNLKKYFVFYQYQGKQSNQSLLNKKKAIAFIAPLEQHTNINTLKKQLQDFSDDLIELIILRPTLKEGFS